MPDRAINQDILSNYLPGVDLRMHEELSVEEELRDRGGTKNRGYGKHTLYSIPKLDGSGFYLFPMEWATGLTTLKDMIKNDPSYQWSQFQACHDRLEMLTRPMGDIFVVLGAMKSCRKTYN